MKYNEIKEISPSKITKMLEQNGYKKIGEGSKSYIYKKNDIITKVSYKSDDCWYKFANISIKYNNKHFPKIYDMKTYNYNNDMNFVAYMENLKEINYNDLDYKKMYEIYDILKHFDDSILDDIINDYYDNNETEKLLKLYPDKKELIKAISILLIYKGSCSFDIHPLNVMKRNNTLVIVDPWN